MAFVFKNRVTKKENEKMSKIFEKYHTTVTDRKSLKKERKTIDVVQTKVMSVFFSAV
jgi:hypothetical protein